MSESCWATWGEPGNGELDCDLPLGHEGPHHVEWEWNQEPRPAPPPRDPNAPLTAYDLYLMSKFQS